MTFFENRFCRSLGSLPRQERSRKEQPSKSVAGSVLTAFARHVAARCRAAPSGTRGRRGEMISSLAFFSLPTPPSDLSATRVCVCPAVTFLRNAHDRSARRYLEHSHSSRHEFSTLASSKGCTGLQPEIRVKNTERWCQSDR